jgi:hypothetical protein
MRDLARLEEGLMLGVFGTQGTVDATEGNPKLLRDDP